MTNEQFIRNAYHVAEIKDIPGWVASFTPDGTFTDESLGVTYRGPNELGRPVEVYAKAFPDMHRELYEVIVQSDVVYRGAFTERHAQGPTWNCRNELFPPLAKE
jgi:hypothetical protein